MKSYKKGDKVILRGNTLQVSTVVRCFDSSFYPTAGLVEMSFMQGDTKMLIMTYESEVVLFEDFPEDVFWGSPHGKLLNNAF